MEKLAEILHELVDAAKSVLTPNRLGELHGLVDEVTSGAPAENTPESAPDIPTDAPDPAPESAPAVPADGAAMP